MIQPLFKNLLILVNGTDASINAAKYAIIMAKLYKCSVRAVYVVDVATIKMLSLNRIFIEEESLDYERSLEQNGKRYLSYVQKIGEEKGVRVATELRRGAIWSEIVACAEENEIDAILVGASGSETGGAYGDRNESISLTFKSVLAHSRCSVLVVREPKIEQLFKLA